MVVDDKVYISVVMAAYNAEKYISKAIESILAQTYPYFEFIIIDDGSSDNTPNIISHYVKQDDRIRSLTQENQGISRTLNRAIAEARYDWIAVIDSDDIALPERLEKQINSALKTPQVVVWGTYAYYINSKDDILGMVQTGPVSEKEFYDLRANGKEVYVPHPTSLYKKEIVVKAGGYDPLFTYCQDLELFNRMAEYGPILAIPEPLLLYRVHIHGDSMAHFFRQRLDTRLFLARLKERRKSNKNLSYEELFSDYKSKPAILRFLWYMDDLSRFCYRSAGLHYGERKYLRACFYFLASAFLRPSYSLTRIWRQVFSSKARYWLKLSKDRLKTSP